MIEKPIVLELNAQEAQWLIELVDLGLRTHGLKALTPASVLNQKITAALKISAETQAVQRDSNG